jgi:NAD(P)-dependent dehydrogenase (short-subunit alcohol dehydrogenase family)
MAALGAHVIAVARTAGGLEELDDEIKAKGGQATLVPLDLTDYDGIDRLGGAIHERWGKLDILVANAGILGRSRRSATSRRRTSSRSWRSTSPPPGE